MSRRKKETKPSARKRGRPAQVVLTRERLTAAGIEIAERVGYEKLTMSRIGQHLGVTKAALYNHVKDKDELLCLVEDDVMGRVKIEPLEQALNGEITPREALEEWAWSYRDVFSQHLPLIPFIASVPVTGAPQTIAMYDLVVQVIEKAGVEESQVIPRLVAIESFIFGSAYDVHAPANIYDAADAGDSAHNLTRAVDQFSESLAAEADRADDPFAIGLKALMYGLE